MKNLYRRGGAFLLALALTLGLGPVQALAEENAETQPISLVETAAPESGGSETEENASATEPEVRPTSGEETEGEMSDTENEIEDDAYRTIPQEGDVISLEANSTIFYFSDASAAFDAAGSDTTGEEVTLTVLGNTKIEYSSAATLFTGKNKVTLDLNGNNLELAADSSIQLTVDAKELVITDGEATGSALNDSLESGMLTLTNTIIQTAKATVQRVMKIENIKINAAAANYIFWLNMCALTVENMVYTGAEDAKERLFYITNTSEGIFRSSKLTCGSFGIYVSTKSSAKVYDCYIEASTAVSMQAKETELYIEGGYYKGDNAISVTQRNVKITLADGVFEGALSNKYNTSKIEIRNGYLKGEWSGDGKSAITAPHSTTEEITEGEYVGFTKYTLRQTATANVTLDAGEKTAELNQETGENVTVYVGETMAYTVKPFSGYAVTKITYNGKEVNLATDPNWDGVASTYTVTVEGNFTLSIQVRSTTVGGGNVAKVGDTEYISLAEGLAALDEGKTLKLLADVESTTVLTFDKNVALDLNGHTLTFRNIQPQDQSPMSSYCILLTAGSLTVQDTSEGKAGAVVFSTNTLVSGIRLTGSANFTMTGGTLKGLNDNSMCFAVSSAASNNKIDVSGGTIYGAVVITPTASNSAVTISGEDTVLYGTTRAILIQSSASLTITGGMIRTNPELSGTESGVIWISNNRSGVFTMTGGTVWNHSGGAAVELTALNGVNKISGNANLIADNGPALYVTMGTDGGTVNIEGNAKFKGTPYAFDIENIDKKNLCDLNITGGYFAYGADSIPFSDSYFVTLPETKVLNVKAEAAGDYAGYYTLVEKDSLGGTYQPSAGTGLGEIQYTYQDFDGDRDGSGQGLRQLIGESSEAAQLYKTQNADNKYADEAWKAFATAYELAQRCLTNKNANQVEIDYRAAQLTASMIAMTTATTITPDTLRDGTYEIKVGLWKSGMTASSMANGALDSKAYLTKRDNVYTLSMNFGPTKQYSVYGHLEDFYIYNGADYNETFANMKSDTEKGEDKEKATEATYSNWYQGSGSDATQEFALKHGAADVKSDVYNLPGTVTVTLPYVGITSDKYAYWCGMNVDAMGGYASAILVLTWSNLVPIDVDEDTLSLSETEVGLSTHESGTKTAQVTARVLGTSGWKITCDEGTDASVATAALKDGVITITALKPGKTVLTVTATNGEKTLTKTITVTVTNAAPLTPEVTVSGSTAQVAITGGTLIGAGDKITQSSTRVTIDAASGSNVKTAEITLDADALAALRDDGRSVAIVTDVGTLTLDKSAVAARAGESVTLTMEEISVPAIDGVEKSKFEAAYSLTMYVGGREITRLGGSVTITVPWSDAVGYAYYVEDEELEERYEMQVNASEGEASWSTDHFSTWVLSTDRNLLEVGIKEGVYSVPIRVKQADAPSRDSMANDAVGDMVIADVSDDEVTYTMFLKARVGTELGGEPLRGHLVEMWYYAPDDTKRDNPIPAHVARTYQDRDMYGKIDTFPREVEVDQDGDPNEDYYIRAYVDAMGRGNEQDALVKLDWDNALDDGGKAAREGFEDENAMEQVIDSGDSVSRKDLEEWIEEEYTLLVQGKDEDLTARFDTDALSDLFDQTDSSIKFVLEEVKKSRLTAQQQEIAGDRPIYQLKLTSGGDTVSEITDGNVEVTLPYALKSGEDKAGLVVWLVDENGSIRKIKCSYSTKNKTVSFDTTRFGTFVLGYDPDQIWVNPFTDVKEEDWFFEAVRFAVQNQLFSGTSETTFSPNASMTRGMLVTVMYRLAGTPETSGENKFGDVNESDYFAKAVQWASENGVVSGYGDGRFGPGDSITREQMAVILYNYAKAKGYDVKTVKGLEDFADQSQISTYAVRAMQWAAANGIINGTSATTLSPKGQATRAQVAAILMAFDEKFVQPAALAENSQSK